MTDLSYCFKVRVVVKGDCESELESIGDLFKDIAGCELYSLNSSTNCRGDIVYTLRFALECPDESDAQTRFQECIRCCKEQNSKVTLECMWKGT
jgi:hypothetical protein